MMEPCIYRPCLGCKPRCLPINTPAAHLEHAAIVAEVNAMKIVTMASASNDLQIGDVLTIQTFRPWWKRLWRWITRQKDPVVTVVETTSTTFTVR